MLIAARPVRRSARSAPALPFSIWDLIDLAAHRRLRHRHRVGHRADVHRRDRAGPHARAARFAAAAGDRDRHLRRAARRTTRWPTAAGGPASNELWCGLEAWRGCSSSASIPAAACTACSRCAIPESPRYLISRGRTTQAREVLAQRRGRATSTWRARRADRAALRPATQVAALRGPARAAARAAADRLGRHRALGVPAVRRHQRDLLLLHDAVAGGRLQRGRLAADHASSPAIINIAGHAHRDRARRPGRPQAAAADRLARHGRRARRRWPGSSPPRRRRHRQPDVAWRRLRHRSR